MSLRLAVVHEHEEDFRTATDLADRVLCEAIDWLKDYLEHRRTWIGCNRLGQRLTWTGIKLSARREGVRARGHFEDGPGVADAASARRALEYLLLEFDELDAVLFVRDQDDEPERKLGLDQARKEHAVLRPKPVIVVGFAVIEREAWVIAGFEPQNEAEQARLAAERQNLHFDPCENSDQLTADKDDTATRSPKRVLLALSGGDPDRERHCWTDTPLDRLRARGTRNGLAAYLDEVRTHLAPLFGHVPGS